MKVTNFSEDFPDVLAGGAAAGASAAIRAASLDDLGDVNAPSPTAGDAVTWDGSEWVPVHALTESDVVAIITPTIYVCDSIAIEAAKGTLDAGTHTDLHAVGGTTVHVSETGTTPGFELRAAFSSVDGISNVYVHGYYTGNHTATIDIYNYDTVGWDTLATFTPSASATELLNAAIVDSAPYRDGSDNALLRFMHADAGNPTHDLYLDFVALSFGGGGTALALDDLTDVNAAAPDDGDVLTWDNGAGEWVPIDPTVIDNDYANIVGFIDGGGAVPSTGTKCWVRVGFGGTIQEATTIADASGSCVVDVNKRAYGGGAATSICASAKPTLSGAQEATDPTLTGWTTTFSAGDIFYFELESVATCQAIMVSLKVLKA